MGLHAKQGAADVLEAGRTAMSTSTTPFLLGYHMPAEWETHESTWLSWPKNPLTFSADLLEAVEETYHEIVSLLAHGERVNLLVEDEKMESRVSGLLGDVPGVTFHRIKTADVWVRDYGPIFIRDGTVAATKWKFNAWGNKYEDLLPDDQAGEEIARSAAVKTFEADFVLEGGSIDVNGRGTCLTTRQCLLNANRNPGKSRSSIEKTLRDYLGVTKVVWLESGIVGDDTDGHVDDIARFTGARSIVCMVESDPSAFNHRGLDRNLNLLKEARDEAFQELEITTIEMPKKKVTISGSHDALPASYANFYIGNEVVLVPTFGDAGDRDALSIISGFFPGRETLGVNCESLVSGFGGIHCVTQQQPRAPPGSGR